MEKVITQVTRDFAKHKKAKEDGKKKTLCSRLDSSHQHLSKFSLAN